MREAFAARLESILGRDSTMKNLTAPRLVEQAVLRGEGQLSATGALSVETGKYTGRSPKDKFIVKDELTSGTVEWGSVNVPMSEEVFYQLFERVLAYLEERDRLFVFQGFVGSDPAYRMPLQVVNEIAWQNLFARQ